MKKAKCIRQALKTARSHRRIQTLPERIRPEVVDIPLVRNCMNELAWLAGSRIAGDDTRLPRKLAKSRIEQLRHGVEEGGNQAAVKEKRSELNR